MISGPKKSVSLLLPLELYTKLEQLAKENNRTLSGYLRRVLKKYIRHIEHPEEGEDWLVT